MPLEPDPEALRLYFQFNYIPDPLTAYRAIRRLPAGGWLTYEARQGPPGTLLAACRRLPPSPRRGLTHAEAVVSVREKFDESVRIRMIADVPLGAFLSGGIDSSSVVASMALQSPRSRSRRSPSASKKAASTNFPTPAMVAEEVSPPIITKSSCGRIPSASSSKFVKHFDEPFADSSAIPTFIVSEFAARYVKVALSGDGGDELFGGYTSLQQVQKLAALDRVPQSLRLLLSWTSLALPYSAYGKNFLHMIGRRNGLDRYFAFNYAPLPHALQAAAPRLDAARRVRLPGAHPPQLHPARRRRHVSPR